MACYSSFVFLLFYFCGIYLTRALGFSVELIHRDSSRSPFCFLTETDSQRVGNAIRRSISRVNHFSQSFYFTNTVKSIVIPVPDQGEYLMSYSVGTPPFQLFGFVDTGSPLIWLQCKPCEICYNQTSPIFDPSKSTTFKTIPCNSDTCRHSVIDLSCSSDDQQNCEYTIRYGDKSQSQGDLSLETLTLDSTSGSPIPFPKTVIGCGYNNSVNFPGQGSGIVGLGNGPMSLISQLGSSIKGKFSYCLVSMDSSYNSSSKLNFGDNAVVSGDDSVSTPMVPNIYYFLTLEGFSVGDNKIDLGRSSSGSDAPGNIIIDSGTTLTFVPNDIYSKLESAMTDAIKLERTEDPLRTLSLCYKASLEKLVKMFVPVITTHFHGANVHLNALNTFIQIADEVVCFAFKSTPSPISIFGNFAQHNFLIGYDLQKNVVSFKPTDCTKHDEDDQEKTLNAVREAMEKIEVEIKGKKFFAGDNIGYLDIPLGWISCWLPIWEEVGSMQVIDPLTCPAITAWITNFLTHPVIKDCLAPRIKMLAYFHRRRNEFSFTCRSYFKV